MKTYADTSFGMSLYMPDANSHRAAEIAQSPDIRLYLSPLGFLKTTNAMQFWMFRGQATVTQIGAAMKDFGADVAAGFLTVTGFPSHIWSLASDLATAHTPRIGTRSLDILHVAAAIATRAEAFATFDRNQSHLAVAAGLRIV